MRAYVRSLVGAALMGALACGGSDGPDYESEIDESNMEGAAETSYEFVGDVIFGIMSGTPAADLPLAPAGEGGTFADRLIGDIRARGTRRSGRPELTPGTPLQLVHAVCEPVETGVDEFGDPIDADEDNVPDDYKLTFPANCTEVEGD